MSNYEITVGIICDYSGCRARTSNIGEAFEYRVLDPGWTRWRGARQRRDYCPEHADRPKSPTMQQVY